MSFISEYLFEVNQFPRFDGGVYTVKDYFFYDSNVEEYGHRADIVVPVSCLLNKEELPEAEIIENLINNGIPFLKRVLDFNNKTESWVFESSALKEMQNAN